MDESIKQALENSLTTKPKIEVKGETDEEKIMSFFESTNSIEEKRQSYREAKNWFMQEHRCKEIDAIKYVSEVLKKNHIELASKNGCVITLLIAITSTLSLYFIL